MFLDASAVVAILKLEPEMDALLRRLDKSPTQPMFSPLSRFEAITSLARANAGRHRASSAEQIELATAAVDRLLADLGAVCLELTLPIGTAALVAAQTLGRCVGHPAGLNLGDCFAYASAKAAGVGLLYKGEDFALTDMR